MSFREDLRYEYPLSKDSVVMDLGCYEGTFAARIHQLYGCRVFAFEPVPQFFRRCADRFNGHTPGVTVLNLAVGGSCGEVSGKIKGDMSGLYADQGDEWRCAMVTMPEALKFTGATTIDLLKINIEGAEFELLEDIARRGLLPAFRNIQVQWHDVVPLASTRYEQLQEKLRETHELTFDHGWVWQNWRLK